MRKFGKIVLGTVGVIAGIAIVSSMSGGSDEPTAVAAPTSPTTTTSAPAVTAPASAAPAAATDDTSDDVYRYEVFTSDGKGTAMVTYVKDDKMNMQQHSGAKLPWSTDVTMDGWLFKPLSLNAQAGQGVESISCRISRGSEVLVENTSTGAYSVVMCNG